MIKVPLLEFLLLVSLICCNSVDHDLLKQEIDLPHIGYLDNNTLLKDKSRSNWSVGCETLDREYTNFDAYKDYLVDLGIQRVRIQGGWARVEQEKGVYDYDWLDQVINFAFRNKIRPWFQFSYGNTIYKGGGRGALGSKLPSSEVALEAWDKWVGQTTERYKYAIDEWEVWNEPDHSEPDAKQYSYFYIRTAKIIREIQPEAKVYAIGSATLDAEYIDQFLSILHSEDALDLVDLITYHGYTYKPEDQYLRVEEIQSVIKKYSDDIGLFQGENGSPSKPNSFGAISNYSWSEISQAKWILRRMVSDFERSIPTNVFSIIDMDYPTGWNYKGLLSARNDKSVGHKKMSFHAVKNTIALLDDEVESIMYDASEPENYNPSFINNNDFIIIPLYIKNSSNLIGFSYWSRQRIPSNNNHYRKVDVKVQDFSINDPVLVDPLSGKIYDLFDNWTNYPDDNSFNDLPLGDYPLFVFDKAKIPITNSFGIQ